MKTLTAALIGSGNVAWHLGPALENIGVNIAAVHSKNEQNAKALTARLYNAVTWTNLDFSSIALDLVILAVTDDVVETLAKELILPDSAIVVHTSGTLPMSILEYTGASKIGVFYPLQTFSKNSAVQIEDVPFCIEANQEGVGTTLFAIAKQLSKKVSFVSSNKRKELHVAAVIACNFTNHLMTISKRYLQDKSLSFDLLKPLIAETLSKSLQLDPDNAQTGPAKRGDLKTIEEHISLLQSHPEWSKLYELLSQDIFKLYQDSKTE